MADSQITYGLWAVVLGAVSAVSLPLGSLVGLRVRFPASLIAAFAAFGAGALIAALSVELVAPTALALTAAGEGGGHALAHFLAMIVGGVLGGLVFVALDAVVNKKGGYVRKTSTTMAHVAAERRGDIRKVMDKVLEVRPFDALPESLVQDLAGMLQLAPFRAGEVLTDPSHGSEDAYIVLEGELDVAIDGRAAETVGPGATVLMLALFVPDLANLGTVTARSDGRCLALGREEVAHLRARSGAFDQACRELAGQRLDRLEQHLTSRLDEAVAWTRAAAGALRLGTEPPALTVRRSHGPEHGSPLAVWLGILLDGIPESIVIGAGLFMTLAAHPTPETLRFLNVIPFTLVAGLFLSNFPEALSSSANMQAQGWSRRRIFLMWAALMVTTALGSGLGFGLASVISETWLVFAEGLAAGAMLTMIAAAMIPEAAAHGKPSVVGLSTLAGFLAAVMFKLLE